MRLEDNMKMGLGKTGCRDRKQISLRIVIGFYMAY
jgi:hypothetical protein